MREKDYINVEAIGQVRSAMAVVRDICPPILEEIILEGEYEQVLGTLYKWQDRLSKKIKINPK